MTFEIRHEKRDISNMIFEIRQTKYNMWNVKRDYMKCEIWHVECDIWNGNV